MKKKITMAQNKKDMAYSKQIAKIRNKFFLIRNINGLKTTKTDHRGD